MIQRRIGSRSRERREAERLCQRTLQDLLQEYFIHEYYSPIPFQQLMPHINMKEYTQNDTIFDQGDCITSYYFLVSGRVLLTRRQRSNEQQRNLVDGPFILGQYIEAHVLKRERSAKVISPQASIIFIDRQIFHKILKQQQNQFAYIVNQISLFSTVSVEALERVRLFSHVHMEKYRLKEQVRVRERTMYLIVDGECKISNKKKEVVVSRFNCIALEKYFEEMGNEYVYSAYSTELLLIGIGYDIIEELPEGFIQHITFIYQAHQLTLQPQQLPRIERQTNKQAPLDYSINDLPSRCQKQSKSNSMMEMDEGMGSDVNNFRKHYVLGYYEKEVANSTLEFEKRKKLRQPKGYFQIKTCKPETEKSPYEMRRREWASYVQAKSEEKEKNQKKFKGNIKKSLQKENRCSPSKKEATFKEIFSKYNSLPSIAPKKSSIKLVKSGAKLKQFLFNGR